MKKILLYITFFTVLLGVIVGCEKENQKNLNNTEINENQQNSEFNTNILKSLPPGVSGKIYYATWDEWGRAAKKCKGWGLCNFVDCWFCCVNDDTGEIVDCETGLPIVNSGTIYIDEETGDGNMIIELNPKDYDQYVAILKKSTFFIDKDIYSDKFILKKGEYIFNERIGKFGGYNINVCINK